MSLPKEGAGAMPGPSKKVKGEGRQRSSRVKLVQACCSLPCLRHVMSGGERSYVKVIGHKTGLGDSTSIHSKRYLLNTAGKASIHVL